MKNSMKKGAFVAVLILALGLGSGRLFAQPAGPFVIAFDAKTEIILDGRKYARYGDGSCTQK